MDIKRAIEILEELKKGGHGGFEGVQAIGLGIEALKHVRSSRSDPRFTDRSLLGEKGVITMKQFIGDDKVILNMQGLRFIKKADYAASTFSEEKHVLEWEYKGTKGSASYTVKAERDAIYDRLREVLTRDKEAGNEPSSDRS